MGRGSAGSRGGVKTPHDAAKSAARWLDSYEVVSKWMGQYDLRAILEREGGLARIPDFLPSAVAEGILAGEQLS